MDGNLRKVDVVFLRVFLAVSVPIAILTCIALVNRAILRVPPTWSEQVIALSAVQSHGIEDLYSINHLYAAPFRICIYPPVYLATLKVLGSSIAVGRWISAAAIFAAALLLLMASRPGPRIAARVLAPVFFLSVFPTLAWNHGSLVKPEFLAGCFSFAGFVIYLRCGLETHRRLWIPFAGILCGIALLTKPTSFPVFAAICLHLFCLKRFGDLIRLVAATMVLPLAVYAVLFGRTDGGIWVMTISGNAAHLDIRKIFSFAIQQYMTSGFVALAIGACAILLIERSQKEPVAGALYFLISVAWFIVAAGRPGSSYSYFFDAVISGSLVFGTVILGAVEGRSWIPMTFMIVAALPTVLASVPGGLSELVVFSQDDRKEHAEVMQRLSQVATKPGEYVLSDVFYASDVIEAGLRPVVNDSFQYTLMVKNHIISSDPLMRLLRQRQAPYAVFKNTLDWQRSIGDYWPADVLDYLQSNYACASTMERRDGSHLMICALQ